MNQATLFRWTGPAAAMAAVAAAALLATSSAGAAAPGRCAGTLTSNADYDQLVVPAHETCVIDAGAHVNVRDDVSVEAGAKLQVDDAHLSVGKNLAIAKDVRLAGGHTLTVAGNVTGDDVKSVYLFGDKVDGNVEIGSWTNDVMIGSATVAGTLSIRNGHRVKEVGGIIITDSRLGELVIKDNPNLVALNLANNRVARRLECVKDRSQRSNFKGNAVNDRAVDESACPAA